MESKDDLIEMILNDSEAFNQYVDENSENGIDLSEVDFSNSEIKDVCFRNVDFTSSMFSDSQLFNVKFIE